MPDFTNSNYQASLLSQFFNPANINSYFNSAAGNVSGAMGTAGNYARQNAGGLANAYGMLNPGGFTMRAGSQAMSPYVGQLGQLETGRANALQQNNQSAFNALMGMNQLGLQQQQFQAESTPNLYDWLSLLMKGAQAAGSAYQGFSGGK